MVVWMSTPNEVGGRCPDIRDADPWYNTVWRCLECAMGGTIAVLLSLLSYSILFDLTEPLGLLSSTMVAFIILFTWIFLWGFIASARDHITGETG
jgi:hypothetical protein